MPMRTALQHLAEIAPSFVLFWQSSLLILFYITWSNTTWEMWCTPILCNYCAFPQKWIDFHLSKSDLLESVSVPKATWLCIVKQDLLFFLPLLVLFYSFLYTQWTNGTHLCQILFQNSKFLFNKNVVLALPFVMQTLKKPS